MAKKRIALIMAVLLLITMAVGCGADKKTETNVPEEKERVLLTVGTTSKTSSVYALYVSTLQAFKQAAPHIQATIVETGASVDNCERLQKEQIDYGVSAYDVVYEANKGLGRWEGKANPNLRVMMMWSANAQPIVVRDDSGVKDLKDLNGKKFCPGPRGSGNEAMCEAIMAALDIKPNYFRGSLEDATNAMKDNQIVGVMKASTGTKPDATFLDMQTFIKIRPLSYTPEQIQTVLSKYPYYGTAVIPKGTFNAQTEDATTVAGLLGDVSTTKLSAEVVYDIVKAYFEGKDLLGQAYSGAKDTDWIKTTLSIKGMYLHAGTVKYLKEIGINVPAELIPPEYK